MILATPGQIEEYTAKGWWGEKTILDFFRENARDNPQRVAVVDPYDKEELTGFSAERVTYGELERAVETVATSFLEAGIGKDDIVMVQLPNCWELAMLYPAVTRAGALISPVPLQWRKKEIHYIAKLTGAKAVITVENFHGFNHKEMMEEIMLELPVIKYIFTLDEIKQKTQGNINKEELDSIKVDANDIFTLCWTSGTEAEPKGCPLSHNNWINQGLLQVDTADIRPGDVQLTAGPLVNMASVGTTFIPWLILGGTFVLHHPFNPQQFIQQIMQEKVNYTLLVPAVGNMIVKHPQVDRFDLSSVRAITMGSAPPSLFTIQEFKRRWDIEIGNVWGQNEGTGIVSGPKDVPDLSKRVDHLPQFGKKDAVWAADITGRLQTKLVDPETGKEVWEVGEVGELAYKGPNLMPGYFKRRELNTKAFDEDGFFYTGDLFVIKENNFLGFFERKKDIIIRGGFNISAQEIENVLFGHPKLADMAAVAMPDEVLGERTCVYVVPKSNENITLDELTSFMKEKGMAVYKLPERLEIVETIPRNPVGKIMKSVLREDLKNKMQSCD
ncbi:MAG: acyl--CoA ligase [Firmicutes bacterium]|nr:acyl--CoA ligase [Bacillota bacterium]